MDDINSLIFHIQGVNGPNLNIRSHTDTRSVYSRDRISALCLLFGGLFVLVSLSRDTKFPRNTKFVTLYYHLRLPRLMWWNLLYQSFFWGQRRLHFTLFLNQTGSRIPVHRTISCVVYVSTIPSFLKSHSFFLFLLPILPITTSNLLSLSYRVFRLSIFASVPV